MVLTIPGPHCNAPCLSHTFSMPVIMEVDIRQYVLPLAIMLSWLRMRQAGSGLHLSAPLSLEKGVLPGAILPAFLLISFECNRQRPISSVGAAGSGPGTAQAGHAPAARVGSRPCATCLRQPCVFQPRPCPHHIPGAHIAQMHGTHWLTILACINMCYRACS